MDITEIIKILVVEDNPSDVFLIKFYLEELDPDSYEIHSVDNLKDAHYLLERDSFDIILLDLHLPDSEGMITLQQSIKKFPNDVFIVLTAISDEKIGLEAVKQGAQDFLVKGRMDSKSLDSSIKFSYQRAKLKQTVKLYGAAINTIEKVNDFVTFLYDQKRNLVYHTNNIFMFFGKEKQSIDTIDELKIFLDNNEIESILLEATNEKSPDIILQLCREEYCANTYLLEDFQNVSMVVINKCHQ